MRLILNERTDNAARLVESAMRQAAVEGAQARVTTLSGEVDVEHHTGKRNKLGGRDVGVRHYNGRVEKWDGECGYLTLSFGSHGSIIRIDVLNVVDVELL